MLPLLQLGPTTHQPTLRPRPPIPPTTTSHTHTNTQTPHTLAPHGAVDDETLAQAAADVAAGSSSRGSGAPGAGSSSGGGGSAGPLPPQGDLGATLRALADQAPAFGGEAGG